MLALIFLERNNEETDINNEEMENFAVSVANDRLSVEDIAKWLKDHTYAK
jgi:prophage maintenance system killer protein